MRVVDRLRRLERANDADSRMTPDEIKAAAVALENRLDYLPAGVTIDQARAAWRSLVAHPGPGWLQRVYANMDPMDVFL